MNNEHNQHDLAILSRLYAEEYEKLQRQEGRGEKRGRPMTSDELFGGERE